MKSKLGQITGVIFFLVSEKVFVSGTDEISSNEIETEDDKKSETQSLVKAEADLNESNITLHSLEDANTQNTTSQDRISYHTKRGAPKYSRYSLASIHRPKPYSRRSRPSYSKSRRKYRRSRRKPFSFSSPSIIPAGPPPSILSAGPPPSILSAGPPIISSGLPSGPPLISDGPPMISKPKNLFKQKPILLSEFLRSSSLHKFRPNSLAPRPVHEFVNEGEVLETNPYASVDSLPPTVNQFARPPPSIEVIGSDSSLPIEQEVIYPGLAGSTFKQPSVSASEMYSNKPPDVYLEDDAIDNIRNVRLANSPPNNYVDREILTLLQKMKQDGLSLESRPETTTSRNRVKETSAAISKLLSPFLSETSIKKIRSYLNLGLSGVQKKEKDTEKNVNNIVIVENPKSGDDKSISVTEPSKDDEGNAQYFIMLKQKNNKTATTTVGVQTLKNKTKGEKENQTSTLAPETKTPISLQSLELQHYIMSLAGLGESQIRDYKNDDYLPRFSAFQDSKDKQQLRSF